MVFKKTLVKFFRYCDIIQALGLKPNSKHLNEQHKWGMSYNFTSPGTRLAAAYDACIRVKEIIDRNSCRQTPCQISIFSVFNCVTKAPIFKPNVAYT
jgi:hypothetical protein